MTIRGLELLVAQQRAARGAPVATAPAPAWLPGDAPLPLGFASSWQTSTQSGPRAQVGAIIQTRASVVDAIRTLDADYACFDITMRTNQVDAPFLQSWDQKLRAWKQFVADNPDSPLMYATGTGNLLRHVDEYRTTLVAWDRAFRERYPAAVSSCPSPAPPSPQPGLLGVPDQTPEKPSELPWYVTSALTVAAVGGVAYLAYATYKYVTDRTKDVEYVRHEIVPRALRAPAYGQAKRDREHGDRGHDRYRWQDDDLDPAPHLPFPT